MSTTFRSEDLRFYPATPSRWRDLESLFGPHGACGDCWCMAWRLAPAAWRAGKRGGNKRALRRLVREGHRPGVLAYSGRTAVGWCAVAPRSVYAHLGRSQVLRPVDDKAVWSVTCLFVAKPYRRQGVSPELLHAAVAFAVKRGAEVVEGYPTEPYKARVPDPFLWTGTVSAFKSAGFVEVARRSPHRPIMRHAGESAWPARRRASRVRPA
jgi:GNAT superfamily N-acetyltransferase